MVYEPETILYSLSDDLTSGDSPVLFCRSQLKREKDREEPVVSLSVRNLSAQTIRDMKLELIRNPSCESTESRNRTELLPDETTCWEIPVSGGTESFSIKRIGIIFEDGSFWVRRGSEFKALPEAKPVPEEEKDLQEFRGKTTEQSAFIPEDLGTLWRCSCGELNQTDSCRRCGLEKALIFEEYYKCDRKVDCPKCGAVFTVGSKFCPYCGEEILEWKYHEEERARDEKSFQERLRELIVARRRSGTRTCPASAPMVVLAGTDHRTDHWICHDPVHWKVRTSWRKISGRCGKRSGGDPDGSDQEESHQSGGSGVRNRRI